MPNALSHQTVELLRQWHPSRNQANWTLATVVRVNGSSYRRAGALMLISDEGESYGLLSGGCLEADIIQQSRRFLAMQASPEATEVATKSEAMVAATNLHYDSQDENGDLALLGLGCGGIVDITLQPVSAANNYLNLERLLEALSVGRQAVYQQRFVLDGKTTAASPLFAQPGQKLRSLNSIETISAQSDIAALKNSSRLQIEETSATLWNTLARQPSLAVFGGGIDSRPLVFMALELGWRVCVYDSRPSLARPEHFVRTGQSHNLRLEHRTLIASNEIPAAGASIAIADGLVQEHDAAVIMYHNKQMDAQALGLLQSRKLAYCALLGPRHRKDEVFALSGIEETQLNFRVRSPAGLDIGAEYPETIALSILAECHDDLFNSQA